MSYNRFFFPLVDKISPSLHLKRLKKARHSLSTRVVWQLNLKIETWKVSKLNEFQKIFFIFQIWLLNWKTKNEKIIFLNLFWFKTNFKKQKSKFSNSFFDFKSKNESQRVLSFFSFDYEIEKWKMKTLQSESMHRKCHSISNFKMKIEWHFRCMDSSFSFQF